MRGDRSCSFTSGICGRGSRLPSARWRDVPGAQTGGCLAHPPQEFSEIAAVAGVADRVTVCPADEPGRAVLCRRRRPRAADALRRLRHGDHGGHGVRAAGHHDAAGWRGGADDTRRRRICWWSPRPTSTALAGAMRVLATTRVDERDRMGSAAAALMTPAHVGSRRGTDAGGVPPASGPAPTHAVETGGELRRASGDRHADRAASGRRRRDVSRSASFPAWPSDTRLPSGAHRPQSAESRARSSCPQPSPRLRSHAFRFRRGELVCRRFAPDVLFAHGLDDPALEAAATGGRAGGCSRAHLQRHLHLRLEDDVAGRPSARATAGFGPACLALYFPRRCGGLNPLTMVRMYSTQSARLATLCSVCGGRDAFGPHARRDAAAGSVGRAGACHPAVCRRAGTAAPAMPPAADRTRRLLYLGRLEPLKGVPRSARRAAAGCHGVERVRSR